MVDIRAPLLALLGERAVDLADAAPQVLQRAAQRQLKLLHLSRQAVPELRNLRVHVRLQRAVCLVPPRGLCLKGLRGGGVVAECTRVASSGLQVRRSTEGERACRLVSTVSSFSFSTAYFSCSESRLCCAHKSSQAAPVRVHAAREQERRTSFS